jgi:hypothetical protein
MPFAARASDPSPEGADPKRTAGRGGCPSPLPFGPIPLWRRHRRQQRLDCRALGGHANPRRARGRVSTQLPPLSACSPLRRGACAPLRFGITGDSARVANDPHHALEATGRCGLPSPSTLACAKLATRHRSANGRMTTTAQAPRSPLRTATPTDSRRDSRRTCAHSNDPGHRRCRRR